MSERFVHLPIVRAEPLRDRRRRRGGPRTVPDDPAAFARELGQSLNASSSAPPDQVGGFDPKLLLKLTVEGISAEELTKIPGFSVVAEEGKEVTILFATEASVVEFRKRLAKIEAGQRATRQEILFAVKKFDWVTPEDRRGPALAHDGQPDKEQFLLDVELWPLELRPERDAMLGSFRRSCSERGIRIVDVVNNAAIVLARVEAETSGLDALLRMRDVRLVDLPPVYELDFQLLGADISKLPSAKEPPPDAPGVVVLDSGVASNHPLLAQAIGDSQGFSPDGEDGEDLTGHGTHVASIALYGNLDIGTSDPALEPSVRLFSGRIEDVPGADPTRLFENRVERAVTYFTENYGCKVFNLSFGDENKIYRGGHVDRFAATLDWLAREFGVLFVVSTGNFRGTEDGPKNWRDAYPTCLLNEGARLLDPAPALNVLTVGSLARLERSRMASRFPKDPAYQPIARMNEPSPFTRSGPGPLKAIKPELVEYGGNVYVDSRSGTVPNWGGRELGELGASFEFAKGKLLSVHYGTSCAAPKVANLAARLLGEYPDASANLLRALLVVHAKMPDAAEARLDGDKDKLRRVVGYGRAHDEGTLFSSENRVTLFSEDAIGPDEHHFFELPLPEDFFSTPARRPRRVSVALSHMPGVRRSRLEYKECAMSFRVVKAANVEEVAQAYRRLGQDEEEPSIPETNFDPSPTTRGGGTVQCATRYLRSVDRRLRQRPYFVVVTNKSPAWVTAPKPEDYALVSVIEELSDVEVKLYSQIRLELQARVRGRARR